MLCTLFLKYNTYVFFRKTEEISEDNFRQKLHTFYNPKDTSQTSTSSSSVTSHPPIISNIKDKILLQKPTSKLYNCPQSPLSKMKVHTDSSLSNGNYFILKLFNNIKKLNI